MTVTSPRYVAQFDPDGEWLTEWVVFDTATQEVVAGAIDEADAHALADEFNAVAPHAGWLQ